MEGMRKHPYQYALSLGVDFFLSLSSYKFYICIFSDDGKGSPPLPVAEYISTAHSLQHIQTWLSEFFFNFAKVSKQQRYYIDKKKFEDEYIR